MKYIKLVDYTQIRKLFCDRTDKNNFWIRFKMTKFFISDGMVVDEVHEVISFRRCKWLEKKLFNTKKAKLISKNTSIKYSSSRFMEKQGKMLKME